jgi:hypothetical protein
MFESLPGRIFLDSCTIQMLLQYAGYIFDGESIPDSDRIRQVPEGTAKVKALRNIFVVNERAQFEWIVSHASVQELYHKSEPGDVWLRQMAQYSQLCLESDGPTAESEALGAQLHEPKFGYLSRKDRLLLRDAVILRCEAFLTVEGRLPRKASHVERELGIRILTPIVHWKMLRPWAMLIR